MKNIIIYNSKDTVGSELRVVHCVSSIKSDVVEGVDKVVPFAVPYKIIDSSEIPGDRTFRNAWEVDDSEITDGVGGELKAKADLSQAEPNLIQENKYLAEKQTKADVCAEELANAKTNWDEKEAAAVKAEADWSGKEEATDEAKAEWDKKEDDAEVAREGGDEQAIKDARKAADDARAAYDALHDFKLKADAARKGADHAKLDHDVTFPENLEQANKDLEVMKDRTSTAEENKVAAEKRVQQCLDALPLDKRST